MENPDTSPPTSSTTDALVTELRQQILFLREALSQMRKEAEEIRREADQQLAAKDKQIERLLTMLEDRPRSYQLEGSPPPPPGREAVTPLPAAPRPEPLEPGPGGTNPVNQLRASEDICPHLRARYDRSVTYTYASGNSSCWSPRIKKPRKQAYGDIDANQQNTFCLSGRYRECPYFEPPTEAAPDGG